MKYKKYPSYKDSGVAWLGEVPEHWESIKFKHALIHKKKTTNPELNCGSISFGNVVYKDNDKIPVETRASYQEVKIGEFLINPLNLNFDLISLRTALSNINVVVSTGYIVLQGNPNINKNYLRWLLFQFDVAHMKTLGAGVRQTVNYTDIGNEYYYMPLIQEQQQIANFLDNATQKIDTLITKQENLIELLKEKRQAVISHAVTKGLNPDVKMKDSGVEWLGDIPDHWEVKKLKYISTVNNQSLSESYIDDFKINYIDIGSVTTGYIQKSEEMEYSRSPSRARRVIKKGDILVSTVRTYLKAIAPVTEKEHNYIASTGFAVVSPGENVVSSFFKYSLLSNYFVDLVESESVGISYPAINSSDLVQFNITFPTTNEQQEIANYLDNKILKTDKLIEKAIKSIKLLKEKRTAFISAAVTGKIDVREII